MPRKGREISDTGMYHVILRGKTRLFLNDADYQEFFNLFLRYFNASSELYAYSLEKNKVHLALYVKDSLSSVLKPLCTSYARYTNRTRNTNGRLFYDRYISKPIKSNAELSDVICFISNKSAQYTSLLEYTDTPKFCKTDSIKQKIDINNIINPKIILPLTDDYSSMSDLELKKLILSCFRKSGSIKKDELNEIIAQSCQNSNISKSRLYRIFAENAKDAPIPKAKKEEIKPQKQELSFWLL